MEGKKQEKLGLWFELALVYPFFVGVLSVFLFIRNQIPLTDMFMSMAIAGMVAPSIQLRIRQEDKLDKGTKILLKGFSIFFFIAPIILIAGDVLGVK